MNVNAPQLHIRNELGHKRALLQGYLNGESAEIVEAARATALSLYHRKHGNGVTFHSWQTASVLLENIVALEKLLST